MQHAAFGFHRGALLLGEGKATEEAVGQFGRSARKHGSGASRPPSSGWRRASRRPGGTRSRSALRRAEGGREDGGKVQRDGRLQFRRRPLQSLVEDLGADVVGPPPLHQPRIQVHDPVLHHARYCARDPMAPDGPTAGTQALDPLEFLIRVR